MHTAPLRSTLIWQVKKTGILEGEIRHPKGAWEVLSVWGPCCVLSLVSTAIQAALSGEAGLSEAPGQMLMKWAIVSEINSLPRALQGFYGFSATGKAQLGGSRGLTSSQATQVQERVASRHSLETPTSLLSTTGGRALGTAQTASKDTSQQKWALRLRACTRLSTRLHTRRPSQAPLG